MSEADVEQVVAVRRAAVKHMKDVELPHVISHGDYHANNVIVDGDGKLRIIDLDSARTRPFRIELASALL